MSNISSSSTATSRARQRVQVVGIPRRCCFCGDSIVAINSKSALNPNRRYFRCVFAYEKRLINDDHSFKWIDEALVDEIQNLSIKMKRLEDEVKKNLCVAISGTEYRMKKIIAIVVVCFLITIAILKIVE